MATTATISAALKPVDVKKENLQKAYEGLQAQSSSLSSFTLSWPDLDSYFTSLQSSLQHKFQLLKFLDPQPQPSSSAITSLSEKVPFPARPEVKSFCEKMDGLGLRQYIIDRRTDRTLIRAELPDAYRCAPDAAAMVLDAMDGFYPNAKDDERPKDVETELSAVRGICIMLLEKLIGLRPGIGVELRKKAMKVAAEWKGKLTSIVERDKPLGTLGFLHLVATYDLADGFDVDELIDYVVTVANRRQAMDLCRIIISVDKISDLIKKLISDGKHVLAVKFICEFEKTDKFPPVPLLKEYRRESKKLAKRIRKSGNDSLKSQNEAIMKELNVLKSVIKCIEDYHLESEYPKDPLVRLTEKLEKEKPSKKRPAAASAPKPQQPLKPHKPITIKHPRNAEPAHPTSIPKSHSNVLTLQQPHLQTAGLLPDHPPQYLSSTAGPYGVAGSTPGVPYTGSTANPYVLTGAPLGFPFNPTPPGSYLYPLELHTPSGYYDRSISYGEYGLVTRKHYI